MSEPTSGAASSRIEPETLAVLDKLTRWDLTSVATIRSSYATVAAPPVPPDPRVVRTDAVISGIDGMADVRVRWYRPADAAQDAALPCLIWVHGGAYIMGSLEENDDRLDLAVLELGCTAVAIDWRLAPEHPFPAGLDDAETVFRQLLADPATYGVDPNRIAIGGASAGAGLVAGLCLRLRDKRLSQPALQLLIYPMLDDRELTNSVRASEKPEHWGLWHLRANRLSWQAYLGHLDPAQVPATAAPSRATDLAGLAPAFVGVGDVDAFLDEDVDYANRLAQAGVPTELHVYPGVIHGGFLARPRSPQTTQFLRDAYAALKAAFS